MVVYTDVRKAIRLGTIAALSDYPTTPVIFSHSNGTEPAESYVVINSLNVIQQGHVSTSTLVNENGTISFQAAFEIMAQMSFIGSLSGDMSQSFSNNINNNPVTRLELKRNKLGFMRKSQIRRAPQKRDTQWVEYHNIDVTFSYVVTTDQLIDAVEGVVIADQTSEIPVIIKIPESIIYP
jgi:hypothetical protein